MNLAGKTKNFIQNGRAIRLLFLFFAAFSAFWGLSRYTWTVRALQLVSTVHTAPLPAQPPLAPLPKNPKDLYVVLDPGHGGKDDGCSAFGLLEKDLTLQMCKKLKKELTARGFRVRMTRETDVFIPLDERSDCGNLPGTLLLICFHINAQTGGSGARGIESWYNINTNPHSETLARLLQENACRQTGARDRGLWPDETSFRVIRQTRAPSVLFECGFLTHYREGPLLADPEYQAKLVRGAADGIEQFYNSRREMLRQELYYQNLLREFAGNSPSEESA